MEKGGERMTAINNLFLTAGMLPQLQAPASKSGGDVNADMFAAVFKRAADSGGIPPETVNCTKPQTFQNSATDFPGEQPLTEPPDDEPPDEIPDELMALMATVIPPVIQEQAPVSIEVMSSDTAVSADLTAASSNATALPANVVSVLESNKEIEAPAEKPAENVNIQDFTLPPETTAPEQTARMPQTSESIPLPEEDAKAKPTEAKTAEQVVPCPLENENNAIESKPDTSPASSDRESKQEKPPHDTRVFGNSQPIDISPERLIAAEQLSQTTEAAPPQTATVDTLYSTLVDSVYTASTSESKYMEIQLKPEFLGKVAIQLTLGDMGLEIKIKANDAGVKGLIADQITQLTSSLNDKGVKISSVDVVFANIADHSYGGSSPQQQQDTRRSHSPGSSINVGFGIGFTEEMDAVSVVDAGISSVEYRV